MAKKPENDIAAIPEETNLSMTVGAESLPAFMVEKEVIGRDEVGQYQNITRLSIAQPQSGPALQDIGGIGAVIIQPDGILVVPAGTEFVINPVAFYPSWEIHSDIKDSASNFVLSSTLDPTDPIAVRSRNPESRSELYGDNGEGGQFKKKFVECLNFFVRIDSGDAKGEMALLTFSGGEHYVGKKLCGIIKRRPCSIFANRFALTTARRTKDAFNWFGYDINNPADEGGSVVQTQEEYDELEAAHHSVMAAIKVGAISVNPDAEGGAGSAPEEGSEGFVNPDLPGM